MKIAIRADGGSKIGMGHIMRTLALAKELSKDNEVFYICRSEENNTNEKYQKGIEKINEQGFSVKTINEKTVISDLRKIDADILITDSYDVDEEYFNETKELFKKTVYIDDINLCYFNVDILINQNANAEDLSYRTSQNTKLLLGTKYLMLREEFRNLPFKQIKTEVTDIMLTVGGADPYNVTENILGIIKNTWYSFHVVIGPSFTNSYLFSKMQKDNIKFYHNPNMYELMKKCDLGISACGSTLYELAACGIPTLGIVLADNQLGVADKLHNLGIINNLGWYNEITKDRFLYKLENIALDLRTRENMSILARKLVDGMGVIRITKAITQTLYEKC